jgi:hypothetical protein
LRRGHTLHSTKHETHNEMPSTLAPAPPTLAPERKHYPALNNASVRMAPAHCPWSGWLDLGDAVAIAYGPSEGYAGVADTKDSARKLIDKVCVYDVEPPSACWGSLGKHGPRWWGEGG